MRLKVAILALTFLMAVGPMAGQTRPTASRSLTIASEPNATVWIDDIKWGTTDASGKLSIKSAPPGARKLRIRATGFKEVSQTLTALQKGEVRVTLVKTTDEGELAFQQAESQTDRRKAIDLYQNAVKLNPKNAAAYLGLARAYTAEADSDEALKAVAAARRVRPGYAEASAVEGRIFVGDGDEAKAIASFKRAITEGKGVQAEAHTGLGLLYKEWAESAGSAGDAAKEKANYALAASELRLGITQLVGAPDAEILYQMLGDIYEKSQNNKQAIAVYEEFLRKFPDSNDASAVSSMIVQLKKQMNGEQ